MGASKEFEWARERVIREKKNPSAYTNNRINYLMGEVSKTNGDKAAKEIAKEFNSKHKRFRDR